LQPNVNLGCRHTFAASRAK